MNGPSPGFLANVWAPFQAGEQLAGVGSPSPMPIVSTPGPAPLPPPIMAPPAPPPPDPHADEARGMSVMPPAAPAVSQAPPPAPAGPPTPPSTAAPMPGNQYPLVPVGGSGVIKAHEVERRGPSLLGAQGTRNLVSEETIGRVGDRNADMAQQEYGLALDQERQARTREAAAAQSIAERDEELAQRQADFDGTVKQLGKMGQVDRGRVYASMSTPQKIAGFVELALSGFNRAPSMILKKIDDDVKAQEFAFYAARDTAQAKQTAFSMAMQKYQNVDAARAAARAAAIDVTQAQFAQASAKWKGTESANRADMAFAALQDEKMMQIAQGIQFLPAQAVGRRYLDPRTGLQYSEQEAKAMSAKVDERDFENRKQTAGVGGQIAVEEVKAGHELEKAQLAQQKAARGQTIALPNGDVIQAPTDKEAETLRGLSTAVLNAQQLVAEAKAIRSDPKWMVNPTQGGRLRQIESELTLAFKDRGQLGALSGPDMELARNATADLTSVMPGVDDRLDAFAKVTNKALQNRVSTIPGTPETAQGKLPADAAADFKPYGKK